MSRGIIILIEGISNSGKTTLCNSLKNKANFEIIPEAIRYLENRLNDCGDNILFVPENSNQEVLNQELLFDIEFEKLYDANFLAQKGENVVIDKSAFSILATANAFQSSIIQGTYEIAEKFFHEYEKKIARFDLAKPDLSILLKADLEISEERNKNRKHKLLNIWTSPITRFKQERVLESEFEKINNKMILDTSNMSKEEVYKQVIETIKLMIGRDISKSLH